MKLDDAKLDDMIKQCKDAPTKTPQRLHKWLVELKQRRESTLRPADKYLTNTIPMQLDHIESELTEVKQELYKFNDPNVGPLEFCNIKSNLCVELVDLQMSCETMLAVLGLDEQERMEVRRMVVKKNAERDYYRREVGK